jgi:hypothetical protein
MEFCREARQGKKYGWYDVLMEEVCEAFLETDPAKQREGMIRAAAVAARIIGCLDRKAEG